MTLIDRYLHAVRSFLPAADQDDIIRELSEDIYSQIAERESELRRPLSEAERKSILVQLGHPMLLAARYRPNRHVIGPTIFPIYWRILKVALLGALMVQGALGIAMLAGGAPLGRILDLMVKFPFTLGITVFGWVTLAFAFIDASLTHRSWFQSWDPDRLPIPRSSVPYSRLGLLGECIGSTAVVVWWLAIPSHPFLVFGPAASFLALAPSFHQIHLPITAVWLASAAGFWIALVRPDWHRWREVVRVLSKGTGVIVAAMIMRAAPLVAFVPGSTEMANASEVVRVVNLSIQVSSVVLICVSLVELVREIWRLERARTASKARTT